METSSELIDKAITEAKTGNKAGAKKILAQVVKNEPGNARAWDLLSRVVEDKDQIIYCLNQVLKISPDNPQAKARLQKLQGQPTFQPPVQAKAKQKSGMRKIITYVTAGVLGFCILLAGSCFGLNALGLISTPTHTIEVAQNLISTNSRAIPMLELTDTPYQAFLTETIEPTSIPPTQVPPTETTKPTSVPSDTPAPSGILQVHFIDVGQGDAILIQAPGGLAALIDGGEAGTGVVQYLQSKGVQRLNLVIATHPHTDHIGGLVEVLQTIPVDKVVTNGQMHTTSTYEHFLDAIASSGALYVEAKKGDTISLGDLNFDVLHPSSMQGEDLNDNSLVLRLVYGNIAFLFTGDAQSNAEADMVSSGSILKADILKVGHHGSRSSSSSIFLQAIQPAVAIYMAGAGNDYGHPHQETLAALKSIGAQIYGTDINGSITVTTDGNSYSVELSKQTPLIVPTIETQPSATTIEVVSLTSPISQGGLASLNDKDSTRRGVHNHRILQVGSKPGSRSRTSNS